jgi:uncharacterized protein with PQ loop repeat
MHQVHAHIQKRKRKKKPSSLIKLFDKLVVVMGVVNLAATLPQVLDIWVGKNASGVSSLSWGYYSLFSTVLLFYGIAHHEKPIIATYLGAVVLYSAIFVGSIIY